MTIGILIRNRRMKQELNLCVAAKRAGMDPAALSRLETGQVDDPRLSTLRRVSLAIETPLAEIIKDLEESTANAPMHSTEDSVEDSVDSSDSVAGLDG